MRRGSLLLLLLTYTPPQVTTTTEELASGDEVLMSQMNALRAVMSSLLGDVVRSAVVIAVCGGAGAAALGLFYVAFMRKCAGCIIWSMLYSVLLVALLGTAFCFFQAGKLPFGSSRPAMCCQRVMPPILHNPSRAAHAQWTS